MKNNNLKKIVILLIISLFLIILGYTIKNVNNKSGSMDLGRILEYKETYVGDNSAVSNIINKLPANKYFKKLVLNTESEPYSIVLDYNAFDKIEIEFKDGYVNEYIDIEIMEVNAAILFALINNLDTIEVTMEERRMTFRRYAVENHYKENYVYDFDSIIENEKTLETFIKKE